MSAGAEDIVRSAERLALGVPAIDEPSLRTRLADQVRRAVEELDRPSAIRDWPRNRYLAALLDRGGLPGLAELLLQRIADVASGLAVAAEANNLHALLIIRHGDLREGIHQLEDAFLQASICGADVLSAIAINLATAHRMKGDNATAARWLERCTRYSQEASAPTSTRLWEPLVRAAMAAGAIDGPGATRALNQIVSRVRAGSEAAPNLDAVSAAEVARIALEAGRLNDDAELVRRSRDTLDLLAQVIGSIYDVNDPRKLTASANATVGEFELARLGAAEDMEWATRRLADLAQRLQDTIGPDDPRTLALQANAVVAQLEVARLRQSWSWFSECVRRLDQFVERQSSLLGPTHEQTLTSRANLASAQLELALRTATEPALELAASTLATTIAACVQGLGENHPATLVLRQQLRMCTEPDQLSGKATALGGVTTRVRQKTRRDNGDENYSSFELAGQRLLNSSDWSPSTDAAVLPAVPATTNPATGYPSRPDPSDPAAEVWALVERAQAGEAEAFGLIYDRYVDTVFRFVYFRVGNRQLAEDLTADTFLRALKRIGSFTWQGPDLGAWLVTIARSLVAYHLTSGRYRLEVTTGDVLDADREDRSPEGSPEAAVVDRVTNVALLTAIKQLNPEQQECIVLRFLQGFSVAETARAMGMSEGAIKALEYRAVRALARLVPENFGA